MSKKPRVRTLTDIPATSDAFGPHKRLAEALYGVVTDEEGNKAIALEGSWGSGKSTVIKLLDGLINEKSETLFIFDAWSHEGDPLRRSFLESLIDHLERKKWVSKDKWKKEKDEISQRREESETIVSPGLSEYGKGLALSTLFVPLGLALVSKHGIFFDNPPYWWVEYIPIIFTMFPIIVGTALWLLMRPSLKFWSGDFWNKNRAPYQDESFYSILKTGSKEVTRNITSKTPDPTSIEFNNFFSQILRDILSSNNKKIIIVMDNLDRVSPETAMTIWSTMRVFFESPNFKHDEIRNRFWLIVPFDSNAIDALWQKEDSDNNPVNFAKSFIDKSFQLTFHVSPPVLSDWKDFLFEQLKEALPDHNEDDFHGVYRIYLLSSRKPSPRDMKIFVNEIGETYRQWGFEIPLVLQAAYVLNRSNPKVEESISTGSFLDDSFKSVIGISGWQRFIAALHFNVELDKAIQVLVRPDIEKSFAKGDSELLASVKNVPAFEENCENLINESYSSWAKEEPITIPYTAQVLSDLDMKASHSAQKSWDDLRSSVELVEKWNGLDQVASKGLIKLIESCNQESVSEFIIKILKSITNLQPKEAEGVEEVTIEWKEHLMDSIYPIISSVIELGHEETLEKNFYIPGNAKSYIDTLLGVSGVSYSDDIIKHFRSKVDEAQILSELVQRVNSNTYTIKHVDVVKILSVIGISNWQTLTSNIQTRLDSKNGLNGPQSSGLMKTLTFLHFSEGNSHATAAVKHIHTQGFLPHHLHQYVAEKNPNFQADPVLMMMQFNSQGTYVRNVGNSNPGCNFFNQLRTNPSNYKEVVSNLADYVVEINNIDMFLGFLKDPHISKLVTAVLAEALSNRDASKLMSGEQLIDNIQVFVDNFEHVDLGKIILNLAKKTTLIDNILEREFDEGLDTIYKYVSESEEMRKNKKLVTFLIEGLLDVKEDTWKSQLENEGDLLDVGIALGSAGEKIGLEADFADPLLESTLKLKTADEPPNWLGKNKRWSKMVSILEESFNTTFFRDVIDNLISHPEEKFKVLINLLGEELKHSFATVSKADELFRSLGKEVIDIDRFDSHEITWLSQCLEDNEDLRKNVKPATKRMLSKRVESLIDENELEEDDEKILKEYNKLLKA